VRPAHHRSNLSICRGVGGPGAWPGAPLCRGRPPIAPSHALWRTRRGERAKVNAEARAILTGRVIPPLRTAPSRPSVRIREPPAGLFRSADGRRCESPGPSRLTIVIRHTGGRPLLGYAVQESNWRRLLGRPSRRGIDLTDRIASRAGLSVAPTRRLRPSGACLATVRPTPHPHWGITTLRVIRSPLSSALPHGEAAVGSPPRAMPGRGGAQRHVSSCDQPLRR
jgi:hypothetical protein